MGLGRNGCGYILCGNPFGLKRIRVEVNLKLWRLTAKREGQTCAGNSDKSGAKEVLAEIVKLLFVETDARQGQLYHRYCGGVVVQNERRLHAWR